MNPRRISAALLVTAGFSLAPAARAAVDAFIWFESPDIRGESKDPQHMGWIEVESNQLDQFRNAATIGSATGGAGAGKIKFNEFTIKKTSDKASPKLFEAASSGRHFPKVTLSMRKAGGDPGYLVVKLENVFISSYQKSGGADRPTESFSLNFSKITFENPPPPPPGHAIRSSQVAAPGGASSARIATTPTPTKPTK